MAKKQETKPKEQKKPQEPKNMEKESVRRNPPLPVLLDISFSLASLIILLAGVVTVGVSLLKGASVVMAAMRGCVAIFTLGAIFWLLNYFLAHQVIETARKDLKAAQSELDTGESTLEVQA